MSHLQAEHLNVGYDNHNIIEDLSVSIPEGQITSIIGPNGCGKSTLLKTISRIMRPAQGTAYLNGKDIHQMKSKDVAKEMALLSQSPDLPGAMTVKELVAYGRYPHQRRFMGRRKEDDEAIERALFDTQLTELADRPVDALSGGQRQRAWIAMALAQETDLLLLDEPTTYLDMAHQMEVLELLERLNREHGRTIVMVLHDLNHASRFSDYIIAMRQGSICYQDCPECVISQEALREVFQIEALVTEDPWTGKPVCMTYNVMKNPDKEEKVTPLTKAETASNLRTKTAPQRLSTS
ncbi:ABC transporter ATP-binding protein [Alkalicoccus urumqiensis]|uniref:Fe(3+)-dicitrate ABC transporter ATP-binding protein n=1 Tax=Alkalicoccus urumqiensis TaxID=1548213 RepID=A0A2P6MLB2_ALKUR|nr:ABC transporter ATP-binding protein [Alkalicoccus urumqiensis]PRO67069.1 Fe(3+)-dicitrate ABC transporter ATP-binding protein [Alkalicoccus urumqiensis]